MKLTTTAIALVEVRQVPGHDNDCLHEMLTRPHCTPSHPRPTLRGGTPRSLVRCLAADCVHCSQHHSNHSAAWSSTAQSKAQFASGIVWHGRRVASQGNAVRGSAAWSRQEVGSQKPQRLLDVSVSRAGQRTLSAAQTHGQLILCCRLQEEKGQMRRDEASLPAVLGGSSSLRMARVPGCLACANVACH